ncbi:MAG: hypothetical protein QOI35_2721 [Cryptosporangiaceae bacterium]|nr:hypothetical protein [Cryptosporangiaceae bacterium]
MRAMWRVMGAVRVGFGLLVGFVLLVAWPGGPAAAAPGESISKYAVVLDVRANGDLVVTENIDYNFGSFGGQKHGIFRKIPVRFRFDSRQDRIYPIENVHATRGGQTDDVAASDDGQYRVLKIGRASQTVSGTQAYSLTYTVRGAMNSFPDHEELYWNAIGTEWDVPISDASAQVKGPAPIQRTQCFAGPLESKLGCASDKVTDGAAQFTQPSLNPREGLSVVIAFPKGSIQNTAPILVDRHDLATAFSPTPVAVGGGLALGLLGVGGAAAAGWMVGRDRRYAGQIPGLAPLDGQDGAETRAPLFGKQTVAVEFAPPDKVRPGQVGTLIDEVAHTLDVTATIVDFAVRGHLHISEVERQHKWNSQDWVLTRRTDGDPDFLPYERTLFDALFAGRDSVQLSTLKNTFSSDLSKVQTQLYHDMVTQGWYRQSPQRTRNNARGLAILVLLVAVGITVLLGLFAQLAILGLGLIAGALALVAVAGKFPARTAKGTAALTRIEGFRKYLDTAEAGQIKFEEREQIFSRYLPYAMVFGIADRWAREFRDLGAQQPDGSSGLYWYSGQPGWTLGYYGASIGSFNTTTAGTIASTPASTGSSGFGGGGFSGGGGGGGGGGSW